MTQNKVFSLLGLAMRAKRLVSGEFQTLDAVRCGKAFLVIVAKDSSANTMDQFERKCYYYEVPLAQFGSKEELGHAIGRADRSSVAICDEGLAEAIVKQLPKESFIGQKTEEINGED